MRQACEERRSAANLGEPARELKRSTDFVILLEALDRRYAPGPGAVTKPTVIVLDNVPIHMPIGDVRIDVRCANGNPRSIPRSLVTNQMGILAVRCPIMVEE